MTEEKLPYDRDYWEKESERAKDRSNKTDNPLHAANFDERHYRFLNDNGYLRGLQ